MQDLNTLKNKFMPKGIFSIIATVIVLSFQSCQAAGLELKGKLSNAANKELTFEHISANQLKPLQSIKTDANGEFKVNVEIPADGFYRLKLSDQNFLTMLLKPTDKIELSGDANQLMACKAVGSNENTDFINLNNYLSYSYFRQDSIQKVFQAYQTIKHPKLDSIGQMLDIEMQKIQFFKRQYLQRVVDLKPGSLVAMAATEQLSPEADVQYFIKLLPQLEKNYPNSEYVAAFRLKVNELSRLAIGTDAPEISVLDPDGKSIKLSDLRGKVVLLDFWASWCGPCRRENPNVVNMYKKYHDKGFEIFSVSLDKEKANWLAAIKQDGLIWKHGSELAFWQSSFCKTYNVTGIPQTFLLGKDGKIIAKGLRGEELDAKLAQIFAN